MSSQRTHLGSTNSATATDTPPSPLKQPPIHHPHNRKGPPDRGTNSRKKMSPPPPILFKLHMQGADLVKKEQSGQTPVGPWLDVSRMLRHRILKRVDHRPVQKPKLRRHHLQIVLKHAIPICHRPGRATQLTRQIERIPHLLSHVRPKTQLIHRMRDIKLLKRLIEHIDNTLQIQKHPAKQPPIGIGIALPLLLPLPIGSKVQIPPSGRQGHESVNVAPLSLFLIGPHEVTTLLDLGNVGNVPLPAAVGPLDVVAGVAAFGGRGGGAVAGAAGEFVVGFGEVVGGELAGLFGGRVVFQIFVGIGWLCVGIVGFLLFFGLLKGVELILADERVAQFEATFSSDRLSPLVQPVLPHSVPLVDVKTLTLPRRIVGVHRQQGAGDVGEGNIEFDFESVGRLGHDVDVGQESRGEVVGVFFGDEVDGEEEGEEGERGAGKGADAEFGRDGRVGVEGPEVARVVGGSHGRGENWRGCYY
mmetsp:Transcript_15938/g.32419  ORF Transcript_15938/g.32419 Transcript_15938/m.32419 type:complete len:473 (+) Transcript_15938:251-1669(+)